LSKLPENCPICGEKNDEGYIATRHGIWWIKDEPKIFHPRGFERLTEGLLSSASVEAYRCPTCQIVLFSYGREAKRNKEQE
jgi:hypothetical protein